MADIGLSIDQDLDEAVAFADASPYPAPEEALEDVFA
jgi:acetoin:2,6-dichlorophenolindophenol oxidoreductase subunit alpha